MEPFENVWGQILADTWADPNFRETVKNDPGAVLIERGVEVPEGVSFSVVPIEDTTTLQSSVFMLPFPEKPETYNLAASTPPPPPPHGGGGGGGGGGAACCCSSVLCCCCCP